MKKTITICSLILGVFCLGCSKDSTTAPTADRFTITIAENEKGIVDPHGDFSVQRADSINIKAKNTRDGYRFLKWQITNGSNNISVRDTAGDSTYVADITGDAEIEAVFEKCVFDVVITAGEGGSVVNGSVRAIAYMDMTHISVDAIVNGWEFKQWVVDNDQNATIDNPLSQTTHAKNVTGDATVTAQFEKKRYPLTVTQPGAGGEIVNANGDPLQGEYEHGTVLRIKVNLSRGYTVESWTGDATGDNDSTTITMNGPTSVGLDLNEILVPAYVICVDAASTYGENTGLGNTWVKAFKKLDNAIQALNGNPGKRQIWVVAGTYIPTGDYGFELTSNDTLYGGFTGYERTLSERTFHKYMPVLDGVGNVSNVVDFYGCDNVLIDGFIIQGGTQNGVYMGGENSRGGHSIINCVLRDNTGYALQVRVPDVFVKNCVFRDNVGGAGSALYSDTSVVVSNSVFYANDGPAIEDKNTSSGNRTQFYNCTIYQNKCEIEYPGGVYSNGNIDINGCILYGNTSASGYLGAQINKVYNAYECNIENASNGIGIGDTVINGDVQRIIEYDPYFTSTVTTDDGNWFDSTAQVNDGILIPGNQDIHAYGSYNLKRPTHDIRNIKRDVDDGFALGAYEP